MHAAAVDDVLIGSMSMIDVAGSLQQPLFTADMIVIGVEYKIRGGPGGVGSEW